MSKPLIPESDFEDVLNMLAIPLGMKLQLITQRLAVRPANLTLLEWRFLLSLARFGDSYLRQLTRRAALDPAHASRTAAQLRKRGLVDQRTDPDDNRKRLFSLTKEGADVVGKVWPEIRRYTLGIRALYTDQEFTQLKSLLQRAVDRADALLEESDPANQNAA